MSFPWHMRTFSPEEKELRRYALDFYGLLNVFATVIVAALFCGLGHAYRYNWVSGTQGTDGGRQPVGIYARLARNVYLWDWFLGRNISNSVAWLGMRRTWVFGGLWCSWIGFMCVAGTGDDYFHLTKRLGQTAASLLPAQYLLSSKFILQYASTLTYQTHETMNVVHRWVGRTIYCLLTLHGALYVNYFIRSGRLDRFLWQDALFGLLGLAMMNVIFITSLPGYRRRAYHFFFTVHQLSTMLILPVAWFHIPYVRRHVFVAGVIYAADRFGKYLSSRELSMRVTYVSATALDLRGSADWVVSIPGGSHFYVYIPSITSSRGNPFTLSGGVDGEVKFLVRIRDGFTRKLRDVADTSVTAIVEGPYGIASAFPDFGLFDSFLFITGGVGVTMTFSVLKELILRIEDGRAASLEKAKIKFIWAARSTEEAAWPLTELLKSGPTTCKPEVDIFITNPSVLPGEMDEDRASIELQDLVDDSQSQGLLSAAAAEPGTHQPSSPKHGGFSSEAAIESLKFRYARTPINPSIQTGRPNLASMTDEFCRESSGRRIAVFMCGPEGIKAGVMGALRAHYRDSLIWVWDEKFGW